MCPLRALGEQAETHRRAWELGRFLGEAIQRNGPGDTTCAGPRGAVPTLDMGAACHTIKGAVKRMEPWGAGRGASCDSGRQQLTARTVPQGWPGSRSAQDTHCSTGLPLVARTGACARPCPASASYGLCGLERVPGLAGSLLPPAMRESSQPVSQGHCGAGTALRNVPGARALTMPPWETPGP